MCRKCTCVWFGDCVWSGVSLCVVCSICVRCGVSLFEVALCVYLVFVSGIESVFSV